MPAIKRLVLDLPADVVDMIEARVAGGEFESPSAYVAARIADEDALPLEHEHPDSPEMKAWLAEGDEIVARIKRGEEKLIPADEVFDRIEAKLSARIAAAEARARRSA